MVNFGVIGTNWITDRFLEAGFMLDDFQLNAVYSRTEQKAKDFARKYDVENTYTDLDQFAQSDMVDAVYIASPTALHAEQAITCMKHGKHVFIEKPMASNEKEVSRMIQTAKEANVLLMEGMKTTFVPNFHVLKDTLDTIAPVRRVVANFCQYSSRYDRYKQGEVLNAFKPELSNGSMMDLGIYTVYPVVSLFGEPARVQAQAYMLESGVDGQGTISATYPNLNADLLFSKITNSEMPSEIQGENGSIVIEKFSDMVGLTLVTKDGTRRSLDVEQKENTMFYEAEHFVKCIKEGQTESNINSHERSLYAMRVLDRARADIGLVFPADQTNE
ncbi:Predicted dehydrogenase [Pelagirhabdus alkalitolerans]|uniref:Predicted dehydrogenase n=1 Tax=Pelagirhabdus alkalitolerans TaxID=1612202 RepID=A0A1G6ISP1_9BACI|nr:Gfo/Idh/MocA family oxidoreductase [Pelagirhabdus alkalitolerans]SDC09484.1 Predicted dehydrogenase [Pelagirhabdus alkalitolerans]